MTDRKALADIVAVTAARYAACEARMAALRAEATRLSGQIADLDAAQRSRLMQVTAEDAALRAGADLRWERWAEQRRAALLAALARQRALIEDERAVLARALGRKTVAEALEEQAQRARRAARARRDQDGW